MKRPAPMGSGGMPVNIRTGQPVPEDARLHEAQQHLEEKVETASELVRVLAQSPLLAMMARRLEELMLALVKEHPEGRVTIEYIQGIRSDLEVAPMLAQRLVEKLMGPKLNSLRQEAAKRAAP